MNGRTQKNHSDAPCCKNICRLPRESYVKTTIVARVPTRMFEKG